MTIKDKFQEKFTSNSWDLFVFGNMYIKNNRKFNDSAFVWLKQWNLPDDTGYATKNTDFLFFGGGEND